MRAIFLNIDGVLNTPKTKARVDGAIGVGQVYLRNLRHIVARTQAKIILSSAWGVHFNANLIPLDETGLYLYHRFWDNNLWIFDKLNDNDGISEYVEKHKALIKEWVVIDDAEHKNLKEQNVVQTYYKCGLTQTAAKEAIKKLDGITGVW